MRLIHRLSITALCAVALSARPAGAQVVAAASSEVTPADIRFMQDMLGHHAQAVEMVALIPTRTTSRRLKVLGERIGASQSDEIQLMTRWLVRQGAPPGPAVAHDMAGHQMAPRDTASRTRHEAMMPGMLTAQQMASLRRARGARFDRLFLSGMIQHHRGALTMIQALKTAPGAAQESAINRFVIDIDADQRAEIARMRQMLVQR